jgi:hypothetical protein
MHRLTGLLGLLALLVLLGMPWASARACPA